MWQCVSVFNYMCFPTEGCLCSCAVSRLAITLFLVCASLQSLSVGGSGSQDYVPCFSAELVAGWRHLTGIYTPPQCFHRLTAGPPEPLRSFWPMGEGGGGRRCQDCTATRTTTCQGESGRACSQVLSDCHLGTHRGGGGCRGRHQGTG